MTSKNTLHLAVQALGEKAARTTVSGAISPRVGAPRATRLANEHEPLFGIRRGRQLRDAYLETAGDTAGVTIADGVTTGNNCPAHSELLQQSLRLERR
jgi:hypothetical protein